MPLDEFSPPEPSSFELAFRKTFGKWPTGTDMDHLFMAISEGARLSMDDDAVAEYPPDLED